MKQNKKQKAKITRKGTHKERDFEIHLFAHSYIL